MIRKLPLLLVSILIAVLSANSALAQGFENWEISSFHSGIQVNADSTLIITEQIVADFTNEAHHGIFRAIPIKYKDEFGNKMTIRFKLISVTDEDGNDWWQETTYEGDNVKIKTGDPDRYLSWPVTFNIKYEVNLLDKITQFEDHDEIYWNVTGHEWPVPILQTSATVHLPKGIPQAEVDTICFAGYLGTTAQNCRSNIEKNRANFSTGTLNFAEGLTIAVSIPKGFIVEPTLSQKIIWFLQDNWGLALPIITFLVLYFLWFTRGKDPQTNRDTVMPRYKPPKNMTPSELGTLIDERADMRDITSAIVDLAIRGYLKISEKSSDFTFIKLKDYKGDNTLKQHEKTIMKAIFNGIDKRKLSELTNKFYRDLPQIKKDIYKQLKDDGLFPSNPENVRNFYYTIGGGILFALFFLPLAMFFSIATNVGIAASAIIILIFARYMPAKTKKGVDAFYEAKGLEEYIDTAEKDRIKFQEKENIFEELLPFAMTLGIADKWTKAFEGIYKNASSWYEGSGDGQFSTGYFLGRINRMTNKMNTTFTSAPRSASSGGSGFSSGGFSGGGFGGGGGGSW